MTRKRLKKLLMANGYDRDCAEAAIDQCLTDGLTHEEILDELTGDDSVIAMLLRSKFNTDEFWDGLLETFNAVVAKIKADTGL